MSYFNMLHSILMNYPLYKTLDDANQVFTGSNATKLNIYIDATDMILSFLKKEVSFDNPLIIISGIINLCAHFRAYYKTRCNVDTKIFIVYSDLTSGYNKILYPDYNKDAYHRIEAFADRYNVINQYIPLLAEICKYINDVYFVKCTIEPVVKMYNIAVQEHMTGNDNPNIIISKDLYCSQFANIFPNTVQFKLIKTNPESILILCTQNSMLMYYSALHKSITPEILLNLQVLDPMMFSTLLTLTGVKSRNILAITSLKSAVSTVLKGINDEKILNSWNMNNIYEIYMMLSNKVKASLDVNELVNRWKCIDIEYQNRIYNTNPESHDLSWNINMNDFDSVKEINDKYFINAPLDLNRL